MNQYLQWIEQILQSNSAIIILLIIALIWFAKDNRKIRKEMNKIYEAHIKLLFEQNEVTRIIIGTLIDDQINKNIAVKKKTKKAGRKKHTASG